MAHPPTEYIVLGGRDGQAERPDVWIKPSESVVLEVKAASVGTSEQFKTNFTLRFPRFKTMRLDKGWEDALTIKEFMKVKTDAEKESREKAFKVDTKRRLTKKLKKETAIAGNSGKIKTPYGGPKTAIFDGLNFCVLSEMLHPTKKSKTDIEQLIKSNGGSLYQSPTAKEDMIVLGEKKVVRVASLMKSGQTNIVKPAWLLDALRQAEIDGLGKLRFLLPFEPCHMFHIVEELKGEIGGNADEYGDSYARDVGVDELRNIFGNMPSRPSKFLSDSFLGQLEDRGKGLGEMRGSLFRGYIAHFVPLGLSENGKDGQLVVELQVAMHRFLFAGGMTAEQNDERVTHIVFMEEIPEKVKGVWQEIVALRRKRLPRMVKGNWITGSWAEGTLIDGERYSLTV